MSGPIVPNIKEAKQRMWDRFVPEIGKMEFMSSLKRTMYDPQQREKNKDRYVRPQCKLDENIVNVLNKGGYYYDNWYFACMELVKEHLEEINEYRLNHEKKESNV